MTSNEIRASFLKFFEQNGHRIVPSSPLVPGDDPTLLFTNAGMNQFKDAFLGREKRDYTRATTSQKCMRVSGKHNDLDNVGPSLRHHTFFEMLGNFSFGDYFKKDAIAFAWTLLTEVWRIPPDTADRVDLQGRGRHPAGRRGVRHLAHVAAGRAHPRARRRRQLLADGRHGAVRPLLGDLLRARRGQRSRDRNLEQRVHGVRPERRRHADPLPAPSIDTGMGLERITAVLQHKTSNYDTDLFTPLLARIGELSGTTYGDDPGADISMRVVADHIRATTFLIGDGVIPSNEFRGYVLRKIMRRAMRHGKHLGMTEPFLHRLVDVLIREMGDAYPELRRNREMIERTILAEEHRFDAVLTEGLPRLEAEIAKALETPGRVLSGEAAFQLYDTFGVPYEFIEDTAATHDVRVDQAGYETAMAAQRVSAREQERVWGRDEGGRLHHRRRGAAEGCWRSVRGLHDHARHGCADRGAVRRGTAARRRAVRGDHRLCRACAHAVLPRGRRPGVRLRTPA